MKKRTIRINWICCLIKTDRKQMKHVGFPSLEHKGLIILSDILPQPGGFVYHYFITICIRTYTFKNYKRVILVKRKRLEIQVWPVELAITVFVKRKFVPQATILV